MDFRYLLFFRRDTHLQALERLAAIAVPYDQPTDLVLPDRTLSLPFSRWQDTERRLVWDDRTRGTWDFMCSLCFEPDDAIADYLGDDPQYDDHGRVAVGVVYLTVHRDMTDRVSGTGEDLVLLELHTPGTRMSLLFFESDSIRRALTGLLASCGGVYGLLDREDVADLFWLRGHERDDALPTAAMCLADIEALVDPAAPRPPSFTASEVFATARNLRRRYGGTDLGVHHWLLALIESHVPLAEPLSPYGPGTAAEELRRRLGAGDIGVPLGEDEVRSRAEARAGRRGEDLVTGTAIAEVLAEAAT